MADQKDTFVDKSPAVCKTPIALQSRGDKLEQNGTLLHRLDSTVPAISW
jgi:hypothetical protein